MWAHCTWNWCYSSRFREWEAERGPTWRGRTSRSCVDVPTRRRTCSARGKWNPRFVCIDRRRQCSCSPCTICSTWFERALGKNHCQTEQSIAYLRSSTPTPMPKPTLTLSRSHRRHRHPEPRRNCPDSTGRIGDSFYWWLSCCLLLKFRKVSIHPISQKQSEKAKNLKS